jgi:surface antigen
VLKDGQVLVAGGLDTKDHSTAAAELFDPSTAMWTTAASMHQARNQHTATLLPNGRVLVAGGVSDGVELNSAEIYDQARNSWTFAAPMNSSRTLHSAVLLRDGRVLVVGASRNQFGDPLAEIYDAASNRWTIAGKVDDGRLGATATLLSDGTVLVVGGGDGRHIGYLASTLIFDPSTLNWLEGPALALGRVNRIAATLSDGRVVIAGGITVPAGATVSVPSSSVEIYDPVSRSWNRGASLPYPLEYHSAITLPDGRIAVMGGSNGTEMSAAIGVYDPTGAGWTGAGSLPSPVELPVPVLLAGGQVLAVGGYGQSTALAIGSLAAVAGTDDYPYPNDLIGQQDQWGFAKRYCTSFAAWRMQRDGHAISNSMQGPNGGWTSFGNAFTWADNAASIGFQVIYAPTQASVAFWPASYHGASGLGHVAYAETLGGSVTTVEEYNWTHAFAYDERWTGPSDSPQKYINFGANGQQVTIARHPNGVRLDLFIRGLDGGAWHAWMSDGLTWLNNWEPLGGSFLGAPTGSWTGDGSELDAFAIGTDHAVWENKMASSGAWGQWALLGGASGTTAREEVTVARYTDGVRLDLFIRGTNGSPQHASMVSGSTLGSWEPLPGSILGAPWASWRADQTRELDAFAIGVDHIVWEWTSYSDGQWSYRQLSGGSGTAVTEQVGVSRWTDGKGIDLFIRGQDGGQIWHAFMANGSTLGQWGPLGGNLLGAATASAAASAELDAFAVGKDYTPYENRYIFQSGLGWYWAGWRPLGGSAS